MINWATNLELAGKDCNFVVMQSEQQANYPASVAVAVWLRRSLHLGTLQSQARRLQHALRPPAVPQ